MYCERSVKPLMTNVMKRITWFLIVICVISCGPTWAVVTVVEGPTEPPWEGVTPSGLVDLWLLGSESTLVNNEYLGYIGAFPLSGSDSPGDASIDGEVGLWYAEGNVVLGSDAISGRSVAEAIADFTIDGSQLSLHWNFEATTDQSDPDYTAPTWIVIVWDYAEGGVGWYYAGYDIGERTETLDLVPGGSYRLEWVVDVHVLGEYGSYAYANLTLDLEDLGGGGGGNDKIVETIDFFDESAGIGELKGQGPARSADNRLNALRNMLENAAVLIEGDFYQEACDQLLDAYEKCDGEATPPDFVVGDAAADLAERILAVIDGLEWK
jgi:hypothetical protein